MPFMILYASVTGKAESIATLIAEKSEERCLHFTKKCLSELSDFDLDNQKYFIIISSTTGDGEQPEKAQPFLKLLRKRNNRKEKLIDFNYTILGLGDSNYSEFCNGPKIIHKKLQSLGGKTFYEPGWADDGIGLDVVVEPWIDGLWTYLYKFESIKHVPNKAKPEIVNGSLSNNPVGVKKQDCNLLKSQFDDQIRKLAMDNLIQQLNGVSISIQNRDLLKNLEFSTNIDLNLPSCPSYNLKLTFSEENDQVDNKLQENLYHLQDKDLFKVTVKDGKKITRPSAVKDCYQITINFEQEPKSPGFPALLPGDAVDIVCSNPKLEVDCLLERLGILNELADKICVTASLLPDCKKSAKIPEYLPKNGQPFSLRHVLTNCVEIRSIPKKPCIRMLVDYTSDEVERRRLQELCSRQGSMNYLSVIRSHQLCLLDLLLAFPTCRPPIGSTNYF